MDMLKGEQIAAANLTDWRKLAQGLHARYVVDDFAPAHDSSWRWARRETRSDTTRACRSAMGTSISS